MPQPSRAVRQAAAYIAQKFAEYGLQPGWKHLEYIYPMPMTLAAPLAQPLLELRAADGSTLQSFKHQLEFSYLIEGHGGSGEIDLPLTFVGFDGGTAGPDWEAYRGLDLRDRIVLLLEGNAPPDFPVEALLRGARGVLWVSADDGNIRSQTQFARDTMRSPQMPVFRISSKTADTILQALNASLADLFDAGAAAQKGPGWFTRPLDGATVHMALALSEPQEVEVPTVLGYLPGSDLNLDGELVVIYAHYDGLGTDPDGTLFPAANHNASGSGILLEVARLWQEEELDPRRPVLFIAWGAGTLDNSLAKAFIDTEDSFRHLPGRERLRPRAVFQLDYAGAGGEELFIHPRSNNILRDLISESAAAAGVPVAEGGEAGSDHLLATSAPWVYLAWVDAALPPDQDSFERIDAEKLRAYGELLALSLAKVVRQSRY